MLVTKVTEDCYATAYNIYYLFLEVSINLKQKRISRNPYTIFIVWALTEDGHVSHDQATRAKT